MGLAIGSTPITLPGIGHWMNYRYFCGGWFLVTTGIAFRDVFALNGNTANTQNVDALSIPAGGQFELDIKRADAYPLGAPSGTFTPSNNQDLFVALQRLTPWHIRFWLGTLSIPPWIEIEWVATGTNGMYDRTISSSANAIVLSRWDTSGVEANSRWQNWVTYADEDYRRDFTRRDVWKIWSQLAPIQRPFSWYPFLDGTGRDESGNGRTATIGTATASANVQRAWGRQYRRSTRAGRPSQIIVPNATIAAGSWTDHVGGTTDLHSPLADTNPATYDQSSASSTTLKLGLTDIVNPPSRASGSGITFSIDAEPT